MFKNFFDVIFVEFFLVVFVFFLLYQSTLFSTIIICVCFFISIFYILLKYNLTIFAIILLFVEIHVIYIVACLIFTSTQYDATSTGVIKTSSFVLNFRILFFLALLFIFLVINSFFFKKYIWSNEKTLFILLVSNQFFNISACGAMTFLGYSVLLNQFYLIILSAEFLIINLLMFFIVVCYTTLLFFFKKIENLKIHEKFKGFNSILFNNDLFLRVQNQLMQQLQSSVQRIYTSIKSCGSKSHNNVL